jgi:hypothetical protein
MGRWDGNVNKLLKLIAQYTAPQDPHKRTHAGEMFTAGFIAGAVADDASIGFMIRTNTEKPHVVFHVVSGGEAELHLYKNPVYTNLGTALSIANKNQVINTPAAATAYNQASTTSNGTELNGGSLVPGGTGPHSAGGVNAPQREAEWILAESTDYFIEVTNRAGAAKDISIGALWYEPSDDE